VEVKVRKNILFDQHLLMCDAKKVKKWKGELNDADHVRNGKQVEY
jgi:hypothetical protein